MPRKRPPDAAKTKIPKRGVSEKTRAEDERLREMLRNADLSKLDAAIGKAIKQPRS